MHGEVSIPGHGALDVLPRDEPDQVPQLHLVQVHERRTHETEKVLRRHAAAWQDLESQAVLAATPVEHRQAHGIPKVLLVPLDKVWRSGIGRAKLVLHEPPDEVGHIDVKHPVVLLHARGRLVPVWFALLDEGERARNHEENPRHLQVLEPQNPRHLRLPPRYKRRLCRVRHKGQAAVQIVGDERGDGIVPGLQG